jgi:hypothetical protein
VQPLAIVLLVGLTLAGVWHLKGATQSTHYETGEDTRLDVVVRAAANRAEPGRTLDELAEAQVTACVLEVAARVDGDTGLMPVAGTDDEFTFTLRPALDSTDRKQYRGCVEDWSVDHLRLDVLSMEDRVVQEAANGAG